MIRLSFRWWLTASVSGLYHFHGNSGNFLPQTPLCTGSHLYLHALIQPRSNNKSKQALYDPKWPPHSQYIYHLPSLVPLNFHYFITPPNQPLNSNHNIPPKTLIHHTSPLFLTPCHPHIPTMPSKIQLDENLWFLYICLQKSDLKSVRPSLSSPSLPILSSHYSHPQRSTSQP